MSRKIEIVVDDAELLEFLGLVLGKAGHQVEGYRTPGRFFDGLLKARPDLCLLDAQFPGMDGRDIARVLRANPETLAIPVIMITAAAASTGGAVRGMDGGADEYLAKPIDAGLLVARVRDLLARPRGPAGPVREESVAWGEVEVFPDQRRATLRGGDVALTRVEFNLLLSFLRHPGRVQPRAWLRQSVWETPAALDIRTVDEHVEALRRKLPPLSSRIETVAGVGYLFRP